MLAAQLIPFKQKNLKSYSLETEQHETEETSLMTRRQRPWSIALLMYTGASGQLLMPLFLNRSKQSEITGI